MDPFLRLLTAGTKRPRAVSSGPSTSGRGSAAASSSVDTRAAAKVSSTASRATTASSVSFFGDADADGRPHAPASGVRSAAPALSAAPHTVSHTKARRPRDDPVAPAAPADDTSDKDSEGEEDASLSMFAGAPRAGRSAAAHTHAHAAADADGAADEEAVRAFRRRMGIRVSGNDVPRPLASFDALPRPSDAHTHTHTHGQARTTTPLDGLLAVHAPVRESERAALLARYGHARSCVLSSVESCVWNEPTPVQMAAVGALLAGRDVCAAAPTGSGKTAAFAIPLVLCLASHDKRSVGPRALVLTHTRELAAQTARELQRMATGTGLRVVTLTKENLAEAASREHAGASSAVRDAPDLVKRKRSKRTHTQRHADDAEGEGEAGRVSEEEETDDVAEASSVGDAADDEVDPDAPVSHAVVPVLPKADVLVATPLMLVAALRHAAAQVKPTAGGRVQPVLPSLRVVVMDEVDKLLEMGFLEQSDEILAARPTRALLQLLPDSIECNRETDITVQCAMFSATLPEGIELLAMSVLRDAVRIIVGVRGGVNRDVQQKLVFVGHEAGKLVELRNMATAGWKPPILIFVQSKERAAQLHRTLTLEGWKVDAIHGDRAAHARQEALTKFRRGETWILITTDLLGRGVDFKAVNLVINYDFPQSAVEYVHRIGRTGRAGRAGAAVTFFAEDDTPYLRSIANVMKISGCDVPAWMLTLKKPSRRAQKVRARHEPRRPAIKSGL